MPKRAFFILYSPPLTRDVTSSKHYLDGKNMRKECQMNNLQEFLKFQNNIKTVNKHLIYHKRNFLL